MEAGSPPKAVLKLIVIFALGLAPSLFSLWVVRRSQTQIRRNLRRLTATGTLPQQDLARIWALTDQSASPGTEHPWSGTIGDLSCRFNARSPHLRCAVNPLGPCETCQAYVARDPVEPLFEPLWPRMQE